jgi:hypothetical protein
MAGYLVTMYGERPQLFLLNQKRKLKDLLTAYKSGYTITNVEWDFQKGEWVVL